jgi:hypothetical protein
LIVKAGQIAGCAEIPCVLSRANRLWCCAQEGNPAFAEHNGRDCGKETTLAAVPDLLDLMPLEDFTAPKRSALAASALRKAHRGGNKASITEPEIQT